MNIARTCGGFPESGGTCVGLDQKLIPNATVEAMGSVTDPDNMKKELYARGPIACGVNQDPLRDYKGGILDVPDESRDVNHVISIVGWGTADEDTEFYGIKGKHLQVPQSKKVDGQLRQDKKQYWIARNSWGEYWGEMGYFRIAMGGNPLGIEKECAWAVPGSFTTRNFPCSEDGHNCAQKEKPKKEKKDHKGPKGLKLGLKRNPDEKVVFV